MIKELFIAAHEELMDEYLEAHPLASWDKAYGMTADAAYDRMRDKLADMADFAQDKHEPA